MPRVCESECRRVKDRERGGKRLLHSLQFRTVASILHIRRLIGVCSHVTGISRDPTYTHCDMWHLWGGCANHTTMRWTIWFLREKKKDCGKRQRKGEVKKKTKGKKQGSFVCRSPVGLSVCIIKKNRNQSSTKVQTRHTEQQNIQARKKTLLWWMLPYIM